MGGESEIELNGESVMCPRSLLFLELVPNLLKNEGGWGRQGQNGSGTENWNEILCSSCKLTSILSFLHWSSIIQALKTAPIFQPTHYNLLDSMLSSILEEASVTIYTISIVTLILNSSNLLSCTIHTRLPYPCSSPSSHPAFVSFAAFQNLSVKLSGFDEKSVT